MDSKSLNCDVCNKHFTAVQCYQDHILSVKHERKVEEHQKLREAGHSSNFFTCDICNTKICGLLNWNAHLAGAQHKKGVNRRELEVKLGFKSIEKKDIHIAVEEKGGINYTYCEICKVPFSGPENALQHYKGIKHLKNKTRIELNASFQNGSGNSNSSTSATNSFSSDPNYCSLCETSFSGPENAKQHYDGTKHAKKVVKANILNTTIPVKTAEGNGHSQANLHLQNLESLLDDVKFCDVNDDEIIPTSVKPENN